MPTEITVRHKTEKVLMMKYKYSFKTEIGEIYIGQEDNSITCLTFTQEKIPQSYTVKNTAIIMQCKNEIEEYLQGERKSFNIKINPHGTPFQNLVWQELMQIPYGSTRSYKEIAGKIGNIKACRAVGMANNKNPIAIIIPCHRVIASDGNLGGYAGGLEKKQKLLNLEHFFS